MVEHTKRQVKVLFLSRNALIFSFVYYRSLLFWWPKLKQELVSAITPISRRQDGLLPQAFGLWVQKERNETWNKNDLNCKNTKITWRNDSSLPHFLLSAKDARLLRLRPLPCLPLPLPHPQRTDGVKVKGGVTVRSSPLPSRSATSCFAVSYFYSVDYSVKHCFLSPIFKKVFR